MKKARSFEAATNQTAKAADDQEFRSLFYFISDACLDNILKFYNYDIPHATTKLQRGLVWEEMGLVLADHLRAKTCNAGEVGIAHHGLNRLSLCNVNFNFINCRLLPRQRFAAYPRKRAPSPRLALKKSRGNRAYRVVSGCRKAVVGGGLVADHVEPRISREASGVCNQRRRILRRR